MTERQPVQQVQPGQPEQQKKKAIEATEVTAATAKLLSQDIDLAMYNIKEGTSEYKIYTKIMSIDFSITIKNKVVSPEEIQEILIDYLFGSHEDSETGPGYIEPLDILEKMPYIKSFIDTYNQAKEEHNTNN